MKIIPTKALALKKPADKYELFDNCQVQSTARPILSLALCKNRFPQTSISTISNLPVSTLDLVSVVIFSDISFT